MNLTSSESNCSFMIRLVDGHNKLKVLLVNHTTLIQHNRTESACVYVGKEHSYPQVNGQGASEYSSLQLASDMVDVHGTVCGD